MLNTKQIVLIGAVVVLIGALLASPIKGLIDAPQEGSAVSEEKSPAYTLTSVSETYKRGINPSLAKEITDIESEISNAEGENRIALLQSLADQWEDLAKDVPQGFVYEELANTSPSYEYWLKTGDSFRKGFTNLQDTALANDLHLRAIQAYEKALELDENSLPAKTGLGSALVSGSNNPMAGIAFLQEVVKIDPENLEANQALGLFSLQSRQFDKAIERFLVVIKQQPNDPESYFYLATGYENIGMKNDAIAAFQKSKELASDPTLSQFIDRRIDELSK